MSAYAPRKVHYSPNATPPRLPELDGLRGLAIVLVLIGHSGEFSVLRPGPWAACAEAGVLIFFVLSGFLITSLLCAEEITTLEPIDLRRFYVRRALRLLPAAWTLILTVVVLKLAGLVKDETWIGVSASLLYVRNIFGRGTSLAHLWSLSLEEQFYFVWPLLFMLFPRRRLSAALVVIAAAAAARSIGIAFALLDVRTGVFYLRPWFRFDSIMSGCVLALFKEERPRFFVAPPAWFSGLTHPIGGLFLIATLGYFEWQRFLMPWSLTLQTLVCVAVLAGIVSPSHGWSNRALRLRPIVFLGKISYSLYLWQQLFIVTKSPSWGWIRRPPVDILFASGCALVSWYLIERPFLALKSRWKAKSKMGGHVSLLDARTADPARLKPDL